MPFRCCQPSKPIMWWAYDAVTGNPLFDDGDERKQSYVPFPNVEALPKKGKIEEIVGSIPQKALKSRQILRSGNDENITNTRQHENRDGIINHRFIENGKQLLGNSFRDRIKPSA